MMVLRNFLAAVATGAFVFTAAALVTPIETAAADLKLAHFTSPKHPMDRLFMRPWTKKVQKMSGGSLNIKIFPGGKLGKGPRAQYKRAIDGVAPEADGAHQGLAPLRPP